MRAPNKIHPKFLSIINMLSTQNEDVSLQAVSLLERLISECNTETSYASGLAGIGCGVQYILFKKYLDGDCDEVLSDFDFYLSSAVYFKENLNLNHATGLTGIASYFFYRLEAHNTDEKNIYVLFSKFVLLSILDILLARFGVEGYAYADLDSYPIITSQEKRDVIDFCDKLTKFDICDSLVHKLRLAITRNSEFIPAETSYHNNDLRDVTVVLAFRLDTPERERNLSILLNYYTTKTDMQFLLLEADSIQRFSSFNCRNCTYEFVLDNDLIFHHTHYRNKLIKKAKTSIVVVWDIDILISIEQLYLAASEIRFNNVILCLPYNGFCYGLSNDDSLLLANNNNNVDQVFVNRNLYKPMFGKLTVGGIFFVNRQEYIKAGLDNEFFKGWGPEDMERIKRLSILNYRISRLNGPIFHLWHPRDFNSSYNNKYQEIKLRSELLRICKMSNKQLKEEVKLWKWSSLFLD